MGKEKLREEFLKTALRINLELHGDTSQYVEIEA